MEKTARFLCLVASHILFLLLEKPWLANLEWEGRQPSGLSIHRVPAGLTPVSRGNPALLACHAPLTHRPSCFQFLSCRAHTARPFAFVTRLLLQTICNYRFLLCLVKGPLSRVTKFTMP